MSKTNGTFFTHFALVEDPRLDHNKRHTLMDIIVMAICAILCGADDWAGIACFAEAKETWFKTFLDLPNGIPSHDTFGRVFAMLDTDEFEKGFRSWISSISKLLPGEVVAVDGKTARRSHNNSKGQNAIHMVSAFAHANGLTLGQLATETKSNEITAIPKLLKILNISGCIITIDAAGCQKKIVKTITQKQADYIIAVKGNQPFLEEDITSLFEEINQANLSYARTQEKGHGREEIRECFVVNEKRFIEKIRNCNQWKNLNSVVKINHIRIMNGRETQETHYYISSLTSGDAEQILTATRNHWSIENSLHWILDVAFLEDQSRIRKGNAQKNFNLMRKITLALLKQDTTTKTGIKIKRHKAGWDEAYLLKTLGF